MSIIKLVMLIDIIEAYINMTIKIKKEENLTLDYTLNL